MSKIITLKVKSPDYGLTELNVERVIAVIPDKRRVLFENVYWDLDKENFEILYDAWKEKLLHKFKVGDTIYNTKHGDKYVKTIKEIIEDAYILTDEKVLTFNCEADWELVSTKEDYNISGIGSKEPTGKLKELIDTIKHNVEEEDAKTRTNLISELSNLATRGLIKKETYIKYSEWIKSVKTNSEIEAELERAYKNADEVQYQRGYYDGISAQKESTTNELLSRVNIDEMVDELDKNRWDRDTTIRDVYRWGITDTIKAIKGEL